MSRTTGYRSRSRAAGGPTRGRAASACTRARRRSRPGRRRCAAPGGRARRSGSGSCAIALPGGPHGLGAAGGGRELLVRAHLPVRDGGSTPRGRAAGTRARAASRSALRTSVRRPSKYSSSSRRTPSRRAGASSTRGEIRSASSVQHIVGALLLEGGPHQALRRGGHEHVPERGVHGGVGHVRESLLGGPAGQLGLSMVHRSHSLRTPARPARTFWRAAASEQSITSPMAA